MSLDEPPIGPGPVDPFEGLVLDDDWVADAALREPTARRRQAEAAWVHDDLEREEEDARRWRARRRRRRRNRAIVLFGLLLFSTAVAVAGGRSSDPAPWQTTAGDATSLTLGGAPTARPAASSTPLSTPADPGASGGTYQFTATQRDGTSPVAWDPCRPIEIVVNDTEAPPGASAIVERAVERAAKVSGLALTITGSTDEVPAAQRPAFQQRRYGNRWAPVLLAWTDPGEVTGLGGDVAGLGGSISIADEAGHRTYVSGIVLLDAPDAGRMLGRGGGTQVVEDVVLHELGHLVGLDHVDDAGELMYPAGQRGLHGYQQGDRTGLTQLGQGGCAPLL